jgi:hypothetical protein
VLVLSFLTALRFGQIYPQEWMKKVNIESFEKLADAMEENAKQVP